MTRYYRTDVIEAMQWVDPNPLDDPECGATRIVAWIVANGGEAQYVGASSEFNVVAASEGRIVAWVGANGGEARYEPECAGAPSHQDGPQTPARIAVRTINGWAYAKPGHYVVMGDAEFTTDAAVVTDHKYWDNGHGQPEHAPDCLCIQREITPAKTVRDFYPCDPETFEKRWTVAATSPLAQDLEAAAERIRCGYPVDATVVDAVVAAVLAAAAVAPGLTDLVEGDGL